ncbi:MAG: M23 family metallopeptidase [Acidobacteriota bacterium]|nr:M23 family metallopeptidase [Acidobacteriota bacterium]
MVRDRDTGFRLLGAFWVGLILFSASLQSFFSHSQTVAEPSNIVATLESEKPSLELLEKYIGHNDTIQGIFLDLGFTIQEVHNLVEHVKSVYDFNNIRVGRRVVIERTVGGNLERLRYGIDDEEYLLVRRERDRYTATREQYNFEILVEEVYGEVDTSLWEMLVSQGESPQLVVDLHQILQWDVDFTALQSKDSFELIVEKKYVDGEFAKYGKILAVQFTSGAHIFHAFWFKDPAGTTNYYDKKGNLVRKTFLKAPFHFNPRVTSRFSHSRYHPILKTRRPHLGVDYGAPTGTPVFASAAGTVVFRGREGGYGLTVKIRHPNGYLTSYAHLSSFDVERGQKVSQGDQIGRVGATGLATGPHLDYRVQDRNGHFLDPQNMLPLPLDKPVQKEYASLFFSVRDGYVQRLNSIPSSLNRSNHAD